jgi:glycerol dehydrogenase-like iron-containing ADH family enzyme
MSNAVGAAPPPEDLTALRRWLQARTDADRLQPLPIDQIVVAVDALARLPDLLGDLQAPRRTLLVQDDVPMRRGSDELKPLVRELLTGAGRQVQSFQLEAAQDGLAHADLENVARLRSTIGGVTATVIAVGSGSVCDVAKHACFLAERDNGARLTWIMVPRPRR